MNCHICKNDKPASDFATCGRNDNHRGVCTECYNKRRRGDDDSGMRYCRYCKKYKHQSEFNRDFTVSSTYRKQCKACQYESQKSGNKKADAELHAEEQAAIAERLLVEMGADDFEEQCREWYAEGNMPPDEIRQLPYYLPLHYAMADNHSARTTPGPNMQIVVR